MIDMERAKRAFEKYTESKKSEAKFRMEKIRQDLIEYVDRKATKKNFNLC